MQRPLLVGEYEFTLDAKNRVAIPARLRPSFAEGVYVTKQLDPCIAVYPPDAFAEYVDKQVGSLSELSKKGRGLLRFTTASAFPQELDTQGRITIPAKHLAYAGITREVTVVGARDHLEIWDRAAWARLLATWEEEADATADEFAAP